MEVHQAMKFAVLTGRLPLWRFFCSHQANNVCQVYFNGIYTTLYMSGEKRRDQAVDLVGKPLKPG